MPCGVKAPLVHVLVLLLAGAEFAHLRDARGHLVKLALNEAEALAMQTSFPHLVFPTLAQEKVSAVAVWHQRQAALQRNESMQAFAA